MVISGALGTAMLVAYSVPPSWWARLVRLVSLAPYYLVRLHQGFLRIIASNPRQVEFVHRGLEYSVKQLRNGQLTIARILSRDCGGAIDKISHKVSDEVFEMARTMALKGYVRTTPF